MVIGKHSNSWPKLPGKYVKKSIFWKLQSLSLSQIKELYSTFLSTSVKSISVQSEAKDFGEYGSLSTSSRWWCILTSRILYNQILVLQSIFKTLGEMLLNAGLLSYFRVTDHFESNKAPSQDNVFKCINWNVKINNNNKNLPNKKKKSVLLKQDSIHEHCEGVYVPRNKLTQFEGISVNTFGHEKLWPNYEVKKKNYIERHTVSSLNTLRNSRQGRTFQCVWIRVL